jgi:outer membrane protein TolC
MTPIRTLNSLHRLARRLPGTRIGLLALLLAPVSVVCAQLSVSSAVDLALRNNPRVKVAEADVAKARAQLSETRDVYIPSLTAGAGLGEAYGYSPNPPTLFTFNGGSLVYNPAQIFYIRSARAGLDAAQHSLDDARDTVAEDTVQACLALQHDQQRLDVINQQRADAGRLVTIVQQRLDGGQATPIDLTQSKLTAANLRLALLHAQDEVASDRDHLARLLGVNSASLALSNTFPETPHLDEAQPDTEYVGPAIASAYSNALARQEQAVGDSRFRFIPQVNLIAQYNRYATFTDSFKNLQKLYSGLNLNLTSNEYVIGFQITVPLYDKYRQSKARETAATAAHDLHEAENARLTTLDAQGRLRHSLPELQARIDVAGLQQQLAQQQLQVLEVQLQSGNPNGPQMTPADEQNARISERDKYLSVLDAEFQIHTTEVQLLRLTGQLGGWLKSAELTPSPAVTGPQPPASTR